MSLRHDSLYQPRMSFDLSSDHEESGAQLPTRELVENARCVLRMWTVIECERQRGAVTQSRVRTAHQPAMRRQSARQQRFYRLTKHRHGYRVGAAIRPALLSSCEGECAARLAAPEK